MTEADQLRERLNTSEEGRTQAETLLQKIGASREALFTAAHRACLAWESPNNSIHGVRLAMRELRAELNKGV